MPVAWDCDLLLKSVVPSFPEIKMSGDAADSTDTRHEPDQVEPGKEGPGRGGQARKPEEVGERKEEEGGTGAGSFCPCLTPVAATLRSSNQPGS